MHDYASYSYLQIFNLLLMYCADEIPANAVALHGDLGVEEHGLQVGDLAVVTDVALVAGAEEEAGLLEQPHVARNIVHKS